MAWTLNGTRIFVNESKEESGQIIPRLQPLGGGTITQIFGYESDIRNITAVIVGDTDKAALKALRTTGSAYSLVGPEGAIGNFLVKQVSVSRVQCICQTLRVDLDPTSPVYNIEIQLYE
jgi:predicted HAD superfamily phosphohydrolase